MGSWGGGLGGRLEFWVYSWVPRALLKWGPSEVLENEDNWTVPGWLSASQGSCQVPEACICPEDRLKPGGWPVLIGLGSLEVSPQSQVHCKCLQGWLIFQSFLLARSLPTVDVPRVVLTCAFGGRLWTEFSGARLLVMVFFPSFS